GLIVLFIIADQVIQGEAVMGGNEVNTCLRLAPVHHIQVAAATEPVGQFSQLAFITLPKPAYTVPVLAVPFCPQHGEISHLITSFPYIPRLGDQLYLGNYWVLMYCVKESGKFSYFM